MFAICMLPYASYVFFSLNGVHLHDIVSVCGMLGHFIVECRQKRSNAMEVVREEHANNDRVQTLSVILEQIKEHVNDNNGKILEEQHVNDKDGKTLEDEGQWNSIVSRR